MAESKSHKQAKAKAPGKPEVPIRGRKRLDSATSKTATEIERNQSGLSKAVSRLRASRRPRKVLQVPQPLFNNAKAEMRRQNLSGTVKNLSGTKSQHVKKK
jgi:hypothetical protein